MYRVILIDDETIILEGLKKVVDWDSFSCRVVAVSGCAKDGAAAIREHCPDIVFTDIKMPDQDGLTMLAGLKSEFPNMEITVLTGYHDFAYAQEAVRLGVTRLLLKPSKMDEINEAMQAMTSNLRKRGIPATGSADQQPAQAEQPAGKNAASFLVREAIAYMQANHAEKLTLEDVANHCYVSQWHLSKLINKHTQMSFYDLLNDIRIHEAKKLLQNPGLKIGDIGQMVGYCDPGHFARVFKKRTGMSANEYRNQGC